MSKKATLIDMYKTIVLEEEDRPYEPGVYTVMQFRASFWDWFLGEPDSYRYFRLDAPVSTYRNYYEEVIFDEENDDVITMPSNDTEWRIAEALREFDDGNTIYNTEKNESNN